jgi:hypothetical protein
LKIIGQRASVLNCGGLPPLSFRAGAQLLPQGAFSKIGVSVRRICCDSGLLVADREHFIRHF